MPAATIKTNMETAKIKKKTNAENRTSMWSIYTISGLYSEALSNATETLPHLCLFLHHLQLLKNGSRGEVYKEING